MSITVMTPLRRLEFSERFLIWTLRRWVSGWEYWPSVYDEFELIFQNSVWKDAMRDFARIVEVVNTKARKPFYHQQLGYPHPSNDEMVFLSMLGAVQSGQLDIAKRCAANLVTDDTVDATLARVSRFSNALEVNEMLVPVRLDLIDTFVEPQLRTALSDSLPSEGAA